MQYVLLSDSSYLIKLEKGEEIIESLQEFLAKTNIKSGFFSGIGSAENPTVAHFRVDTKKYSEKNLSGIFEVTNLTGNVALFEEKPLIHPHVTLTDEEMNAFGGHLVGAKVSAALEIYFTTTNVILQKKFSEEVGLKLFDLDH